MTETDRVIDEIRRSRCRMSAECGHDIERLVEMLQEYNGRYAEQVRRYQELRRAVPAPDDASD
jgi:hypothetical protein